ncbi:MAG: hypothetical protein U0487_03885 [Patescibacteria group bacterium]
MSQKSATFWAILTVIAFPIGMLAAGAANASSLTAFLAGMLSCFAVLFANAAADGRLWMFHPAWKARFDHPEFSYRLAIFCGALLLIVQTIFLVFVLFGATGNRAMLKLVFERECMAPRYGIESFCQSLDTTLKNLPE